MNRHARNDEMQSAVFINRARTWGRSLEEAEAMRSGTSIPEARKKIARKTGISPGTFENLRNGRLKSIGVHFYARLREAAIAEMDAEIRRLTHEINIARQSGFDARDDEVAAAEAALAKARTLMGKG